MKSILCLLLFISISGKCQKLTFLVGPQVGFPNGNFKLSSETGIGIFSRFDYRISERFNGFASIDGVSFAEKSVTLNTNPSQSVKSKVGIEALQLGGRFDFIKRPSGKLYVSAELGVSGVHFQLSNDVGTQYSYNYYFSDRYGIGYSIKRWDIAYSLQYISNGENSLNYNTIRLGYLLKFK